VIGCVGERELRRSGGGDLERPVRGGGTDADVSRVGVVYVSAIGIPVVRGGGGSGEGDCPAEVNEAGAGEEARAGHRGSCSGGNRVNAGGVEDAGGWERGGGCKPAPGEGAGRGVVCEREGCGERGGGDFVVEDGEVGCREAAEGRGRGGVAVKGSVCVREAGTGCGGGVAADRAAVYRERSVCERGEAEGWGEGGGGGWDKAAVEEKGRRGGVSGEWVRERRDGDRRGADHGEGRAGGAEGAGGGGGGDRLYCPTSGTIEEVACGERSLAGAAARDCQSAGDSGREGERAGGRDDLSPEGQAVESGGSGGEGDGRTGRSCKAGAQGTNLAIKGAPVCRWEQAAHCCGGIGEVKGEGAVCGGDAPVVVECGAARCERDCSCRGGACPADAEGCDAACTAAVRAGGGDNTGCWDMETLGGAVAKAADGEVGGARSPVHREGCARERGPDAEVSVVRDGESGERGGGEGCCGGGGEV